MTLFLVTSLPLYLFLVASSVARSPLVLVRVVRAVCLGVFAYIPIYLLSRIIPDHDFFPWDVMKVFQFELLESREAFLRIAALVYLLIIICFRSKLLSKVGKDSGGSQESIVPHRGELLCWLSGYLMCQNIHDLLLLGPLPSVRELFFFPLSRIVFAQCLVSGLVSQRFVRLQHSVLWCQQLIIMLLFGSLAILLPGLSSAFALLFNIYWELSLVLFGVMVLWICYHLSFCNKYVKIF